MKLLVAALVFIATLGLTTKSIANETANHEAKAHTSSGHENLSEKMNALFPEKQKNANLGARPDVTELTAPAFLATVAPGSVKLQWKETATSSDYHVQVATDPQFKWLVVNEKFVKTTSYDFNKAEAGQRYFWRVASFKGDNNPSYTKSNFVSSAFNVK